MNTSVFLFSFAIWYSAASPHPPLTSIVLTFFCGCIGIPYGPLKYTSSPSVKFNIFSVKHPFFCTDSVNGLLSKTENGFSPTFGIHANMNCPGFMFIPLSNINMDKSSANFLFSTSLHFLNVMSTIFNCFVALSVPFSRSSSIVLKYFFSSSVVIPAKAVPTPYIVAPASL